MPTSNPIEILLSHDKWATQKVIDACRDLTQEQFHQEFEMGLGTLHNSIVHIISAMYGWSDLLAQREARPRLEYDERSIEQLTELHNQTSEEFTKLALAHPVDEAVSGERGGRSYTFMRGAVVTHVTTHGMHHRAQCLNMLRQLGVESLPASSVVEWTMMADS